MTDLQVYQDEDGVVHSRTHPDRAVKDAGPGVYDNKFILYERHGNSGIRVGLTDHAGALRWLDGQVLADVDQHVTVPEKMSA